MAALDIANGALVAGAATVTFAARYESFEIKNEDASASFYVTTNGATPTIGGADCFEVSAGERVSVPNNGPMWWQGYSKNPGSTVMIAGTGTSGYEVIGTS
jgi:hypothetical protein